MTDRTVLKKHLSNYKESALGVTEPGFLRYQGRALQRGLVLEDLKWNDPPARRCFECYGVSAAKSFDQTPAAQQPSSSQALAPNLFRLPSKVRQNVVVIVLPCFESRRSTGQNQSSRRSNLCPAMLCILRFLYSDNTNHSQTPRIIGGAFGS
jgi:hypothetical protein